MIRNAKHSDAESIAKLAIEELKRMNAPLAPSLQATRDHVRGLLAPPHYARVWDAGGDPRAAIVAATSYGAWFSRQQCAISIAAAEPGFEDRLNELLADFKAWVEGRPAIKMVCADVGSLSVEALHECGFDREIRTMYWVR